MALEGNERIVLLQPGMPTRDQHNQEIPGPPIEHRAWARRLDVRGREREEAGRIVGRFPAIFRFRKTRGLAGLDERWQIRDQDGRTWNVESVLVSSNRLRYEVHAWRTG